MSKFLKQKSIASFVYAGISILTLITTIVYTMFSSKYGIRETTVIIALLSASIIAMVLFATNTVVDSYLEVATSALISVGFALLAASCVGDFADAISHVVMFGSGAPIGGIVAIHITLVINLLATFVGAGLKKEQKNEKGK